MGSQSRETMDDIDRIIMGILATNPRTPYSDIAEELDQQGYQMSSEGIRYRVQNLFESTSPFFMLDPKEHEWYIVRVMIHATDESGAREELIERLTELPFWFVSSGFGSFDVYAIATAPGMAEIEELLDGTRSIELIDGYDYNIETKRLVDLKEYLPNISDD